MISYRIIGLMSGTSLDGVDVADVMFTKSNGKWSYELINSKEYAFNSTLLSMLREASKLPLHDFFELSASLGLFYGELVNQFIEEKKLNKSDFDAVSSHGQTVFHQPEKGYTVQIGNGPEGSVKSGLKWVCDYRTKDVALGGQGAPLVPIGDYLLFKNQAEGFLNLGGFANISYFTMNEIVAHDICPANIVLNQITNKIIGKEYDHNGDLGKKGKVDLGLLEQLNSLSFYGQNPPKSLGTEWVDSCFLPCIKNEFDKNDLSTIYHHIGSQIGACLNQANLKSVLVTGGGAKNKFLMQLIRENYLNGELILPPDEMINFKEAIVFAFLGALRLNGDINIFSSYTGAMKDSCSGIIHYP